jgi:tripartite motif-containing protein 71
MEQLLELSRVNSRQQPHRIAIDSQGRVLVTDPGSSVVHVLDTKNHLYWQITGNRRRPLGTPVGIAVDARDNIYVTDLRPPRIVVLHPDGHLVRVIGAGVLETPAGLWIDKQNGRLYVSDAGKDQILSFDLEGKVVGAFGTWGNRPGQFIHPQDVVLHRKTLVVLDAGNARLQMFDLQGRLLGMWPLGVDRPTGLAFDDDGNLYYVDRDTGSLVAVDLHGKLSAMIGRRRRLFSEPDFYCASVDPHGDVVTIRSPFQLHVLRLVPDASP